MLRQSRTEPCYSLKILIKHLLHGFCYLLILLGLVFLTQNSATAQSNDSLGHGYSRPARSPHGSRSEVIAPHGMVAASQPLAAQVGLDILKAGGNAIDAAVAVNAVLGLVEPHMNGVGGDLFAIVWDAKSEQLYGLNATGRAPYEISREHSHMIDFPFDFKVAESLINSKS